MCIMMFVWFVILFYTLPYLPNKQQDQIDVRYKACDPQMIPVVYLEVIPYYKVLSKPWKQMWPKYKNAQT